MLWRLALDGLPGRSKLPRPIDPGAERVKRLLGLISVIGIGVLAGGVAAALYLSIGDSPDSVDVEQRMNRTADSPTTLNRPPSAASSEAEKELVELRRALDESVRERGLLDARVARLELQLLELADRFQSAVEGALPAPGQESDSSHEDRAAASISSEPHAMEAYAAVGLDPSHAREIERIIARMQMDALYLKDQAIREGWFESERYRQERNLIESKTETLRSEIGSDSYDRYLFASGQNNRVRIESLIDESPADVAGLLPGDVIVRYGEQRVLSFRDINTATSQGVSGALERIEIQRRGTSHHLYVPRGPLGVRLVGFREAP